MLPGLSSYQSDEDEDKPTEKIKAKNEEVKRARELKKKSKDNGVVTFTLPIDMSIMKEKEKAKDNYEPDDIINEVEKPGEKRSIASILPPPKNVSKKQKISTIEIPKKPIQFPSPVKNTLPTKIDTKEKPLLFTLNNPVNNNNDNSDNFVPLPQFKPTYLQDEEESREQNNESNITNQTHMYNYYQANAYRVYFYSIFYRNQLLI